MTTSYVIRTLEEGECSYWSNKDGWGELATATRFTPEECEKLNLPLNGCWILEKDAHELDGISMIDRLKCPSCGVPTIEDKQQDITEEERLCARCSIDGKVENDAA